MVIKEKVNLKNFNTFGIDAESSYFVNLDCKCILPDILDFVKSKNLKYLVLGEGSNILFTGDFNGLVIKNELKGYEILDESDKVLVKVGAGENWDSFVRFCVKNNWWGVENLALIPGSVGASPVQNIGAYGVEVKDVIQYVEYFDPDKNCFNMIAAKDCEFGYRQSIFKNEFKKMIITSVTFKLAVNSSPDLSYEALNSEIQKRGLTSVSVNDIYNIVKEIRESKLPDYKLFGNAGSFFKNPVIEKNLFVELQRKYPDMKFFDTDDGKIKIPAGWLIEKSGFKGKRTGNTGSYEKQALIIVNYGDATGAEIYDYSQLIVDTVCNNFSIKLEREVNIF